MTVARPSARAETAADHPTSRGPAIRFALVALVGVAATVGIGVALDLPAPAVAVAAAALAVVSIGCAIAVERDHPHRRLGAANIVTLGRLSLVAILFSILLAGGGDALVVIAMSVVALSLDGVDGYLARRQHLESPFGARFDMEVDSAFALVLALLATLGPAGAFALILGLPRYLFWVAGRAMPWVNGALPPRMSRKVICVVQLIALIVLQLPWLPVPLALTIVAVTAAVLAWSFGVDIRTLWIHRKRPVT